MQKKLRVCLLFGGKTGEHEVSLQSAKSIYEALDKQKYDVILVGIDKEGRWLLGNNSEFLLNSNNPKLINLDTESPEVIPVQKRGEVTLSTLNDVDKTNKIDIFFPIIHGTYGEDGSLQGFLELMGAPYIGAGVLGSAIGMDKDIMKRLLKLVNIPVAKFFVLKKSQMNQIGELLDGIIAELKFPIFVKPANLGSSIGIAKVFNRNDLITAIEDSFHYDRKILLEEFVDGREIEISVLGNDDPQASLPGEIIPHHDFYSYEAKYIDENGAQLDIPAQLSKEEVKKVQELALLAYKSLECSGMARVDFFLKEDGTFILNEINTLPGFTKISMYPQLWEASGLSYTKLLDNLIELAIEKHTEKTKLKRSFNP